MAKLCKLLTIAAIFFAVLTIFISMAFAQAGNVTTTNNVNNTSSWEMNVGQLGSSGGGTSSGSSDSNIPRSFPIPAQPVIPSLPNYWGIITPDGRFQKLADVALFKPDWSYGEAENLIKQKGGKVEVTPVRFSAAGTGSSYLQVIMVRPRDQREMHKFNDYFELVGICNIYAENGASSMKALGHAIKEGLGMGAHALSYNEGAALELIGSAWGIGINNSLSVVSGGQAGAAAGNVVAGGVGYTKARAHYATNPWLQISYYRYRPGKTAYPAPSSLPAPQPMLKSRTQLPPALKGPAGGNNGGGYPDKPYPEESRLQSLKEGKTAPEANPTITVPGN